MRFGTYYFFQAPPGRSHTDIIHDELTQMEWAEELGFDEVWLTEHHFIDYGLAVDPATLATAAAARTRRVRIGLAAAILPFHHPIRLAEQFERSRDRAITDLHVSANGSTVSLGTDTDPSRDATVPIWAARRNADLLSEALGRPVEIEA